MTLGIHTWEETLMYSEVTQCRCARKSVWVKAKCNIATSLNMTFLWHPMACNRQPALIIHFSLTVSQMMHMFLKKWAQQSNRREAVHCEILWGSGGSGFNPQWPSESRHAHLLNSADEILHWSSSCQFQLFSQSFLSISLKDPIPQSLGLYF